MNTELLKNIYTDKRAFMVLSFVTILLFTLYIYFISASIVHVVMRTEINQDTREIASEISTLESKYIAVQHKVSSDVATLNGYQKAPHKIFIDRTEDTLALRNALSE